MIILLVFVRYFFNGKRFSAKYRENKRDKEKAREYKKNYRKNNKEKFKKYYLKFKEYHLAYSKNRRLTDTLYRLTLNLRSLTYQSFKNKGLRKNKRTENILGCSFEFMKEYIENKFENWMTWETQGRYNGEFNYGWDIDHIIPLSSAKTEEELIQLCHYLNLQPLCSKVNRDIKFNKL